MMFNAVTMTATLATAVAAFDCTGPYFNFYNRGGPAMSIQRLDPALFPGQESPHLHSFDGGNGLLPKMSFADTQSSTCTTARIKPDKSLYWRPTLFWNGNNTGFHRVPEMYLKTYYRYGDDGNAKANVSEFPEDFQMMAGDPFKRADGDNPGKIRWSCLKPDGKGGRIDTPGFPSGFTSCKDGFATEITFPSCWNGKALDPSNPTAHMAWPDAGGKTGLDKCPSGFQVARFPEIFIEFWYDISGFEGQYGSNDTPWVLAQGDPTGFGMHADFRNGWEKGVLAKAMAPQGYCNCGCGCSDETLKVCFGSDAINNNQDSSFASCAAKNAYPGDDKTVLDTLPGCNPIQSGPARATQATGNCDSKAAATDASKASTAQPTSSAYEKRSNIPSFSLATEIARPTKSHNSSSPAVSGCAVSRNGTAVASGASTGYIPAPTGGIWNTTCDDVITEYTTVTSTATVTLRPSHIAKHKRHGSRHHY